MAEKSDLQVPRSLWYRPCCTEAGRRGPLSVPFRPWTQQEGMEVSTKQRGWTGLGWGRARTQGDPTKAPSSPYVAKHSNQMQRVDFGS